MNRILQTSIDAVKSAKFWKELIIMTVGMMIVAAAIYYFINPSKIILGSIAGLSVVISEVFGMMGVTVKISWVILILNTVLLVLAYVLLGKEFGLKTVYTAMITGPLVEFWEWVYPVENFFTEPGQTSVMNDVWLDLVCIVLFLSVAQSLLFHINASTGGLDIVAKILNVYTRMDIGSAVSLSGYVICTLGFLVNPFRMVLVGLIGTWFNGLVVDFFTASLNKRKRVCIISSSHEQIRKYILTELDRGCSLYEVTGGYSMNKSVEIQALLTQHEFAKLMDFMEKNAINAFVTAGNVAEIYGHWHSKPHRGHFHSKDNVTIPARKSPHEQNC